MSLPAFQLHRPLGLAEAMDLLDRFEDDAAFYMGGTELLLLMKLGFAQPAHLVDGKRLPELLELSVDEHSISMGAGVTHRRLEHHQDIRRVLPAFSLMERQVANVRVRNAGTIGGNLCFAEPHSDPATLLMALGASVHLASRLGERRIALAEFLQGAFLTALRPGEIMTRVEVPLPPHGARVGYQRLAFKERPTVAAAAVIAGDRSQVWIGALGGLPLQVDEAARALGGSDGGDVEAAVEAVREAVLGRDHAEGADYRAHLAGVMVRRAIAGALPSSPLG